MLRGEMGESAVITINGQDADLHSAISANDRIYIKESTCGRPASGKIENLREYQETLKFLIDGRVFDCPKFVTANGTPVTGSYEIRENDEIQIPTYYTVEQLAEFLDVSLNEKTLYINGHEGRKDEPVYENFRIDLVNRKENDGYILVRKMTEEDAGNTGAGKPGGSRKCRKQTGNGRKSSETRFDGYGKSFNCCFVWKIKLYLCRYF